PWRKFLHFAAEFYLATTDKMPIPEGLRKFALTVTGIAYDDLMLYRYLGAISSVVEVTRYSNAKGDMVIDTNPEKLDDAIRALMEKDALATGEDFLVTFARIAYHTDAWVELMNRVAAKAGVVPGTKAPAARAKLMSRVKTIVKGDDDAKDDTKDDAKIAGKDKKANDDSDDDVTPAPAGGGSAKWMNLYARMQKAEKRANALGALPYVFPPTVALHLRFALFQLGEFLLTANVVHSYWDTLKPFIPFLH
ncbi:MAG: hypothetical protein ACXWQE_14350, partial [Bdellovibrionales bacterium]